jgi:hypothetical protein
MTNETDLEKLQRERATGAYELHVDRAPTTERGWRSLRVALRFARSDDELLRARVPGAVRKGAEADLLDVLARVRGAGHRGRIIPRKPRAPD